MICPHCGTEAKEGDGFCSGCGRGLGGPAEEAAALAAEATPREAPRDAPASTPPPSSRPAGAASWSETGLRPYLHNGSWYTRSQGVVYQYDAAAGTWIARTDAAIPFFMRRPAFASLRTPSLVLYALFGVFFVLTVLAIVADGYQYANFQRSADGEFVSEATLDGARDFFDVARGFQSLSILAIVPFFIWFTRRATCNVRSLGAAKPEFSAGWAVGWWFIPFANWVQPLRVWNQAWRASDPALPLEESDAWRRSKLTPWIPAWWLAYMVVSTLWSVSVNALTNENLSDRDIAGLSAFSLLADVALAGAGVLAVVVIAKLTRRQERANARFDLSAT